MTDFEVKVYSQYRIPQFIEYFKDKFAGYKIKTICNKKYRLFVKSR